MPANQESAVVVSRVSGASYVAGPTVRSSGTSSASAAFYVFRLDDTTTGRVRKFASGSFTNIGSAASGTFADGDLISLKAFGSTLTVCQNHTPILSVTDTDITTGQPGLFISVVNAGVRIDDWQGNGVNYLPRS